MAREIDYSDDIDKLFDQAIRETQNKSILESSGGSVSRQTLKDEEEIRLIEDATPKISPDITQKAMETKRENSGSIVGTTIYTLGWLASPLSAPSAWALAPFTHDYQSSTFLGQTGEAFEASFKGAINRMFPVYGEPQEDYAGKIVEKLFPDAPAMIKNGLSLTLDTVSDPGVTLGVGFGKTLQKGVQVTRAERMAGRMTNFRGMMTRGVQELLLTAPFPEEEANTLLKLASKVDEGDKEAVKLLNDLLDSPKYQSLYKAVETQELQKFQDEIKDAFGFTERIVLNDGTVLLSKEYEKEVNRIAQDIQKSYGKRALAEYEANLKADGITGQALKEKIKEFKVPTKALSGEELSEIRRLAHAEIRLKQASKYNKYVTEYAALSKYENSDYLSRAVENGEIFRTFRLRKEYLTEENFPEAIQTLADSYRQLYMKYKNKDIDKKLMLEQAPDTPLNNIIDKKPGQPWTPIEHFVSKGVLESLNAETHRLLAKSMVTQNPYDKVAALQAMEMLKRVVVHKADANYIWGASGDVMQMVYPTDGSLMLNNLPEMLDRVARVQDEGTDAMLKVLAGYYADTAKIGKDLNFISRVVNSNKLLEDMLFESYVNANLSGITTSFKNVLSNAAMVALQPAERFLTVPWGNSEGFQEGFQMMYAIGEATKDVLYFWADKAAQSKYIGNVIPNKAADAARFRMLDIENTGKYPLSYLDPTTIPIHEALQVTKRKNISAGNLGIDPASKLGRSIDKTGRFVRLPGTLLAYQDAAFKMIGNRMSIRQQAWAEAKKIAGNDKVGFEKYFKESLARPGEGMQKRAQQFADYITFQETLGKTGSDMQRLMQARLSRWFFPYVRTPINLVKVGAEHTPLNFFKGIIDYKKTGDVQSFQNAMSRATMGTMVMGATWMAFDDTEIVGGYDFDSEYGKRMRALKIPPYSIKRNGKWISFEGIDFLRSTVGLVATGKRILGQLDLERPEDQLTADKVVAAITGAFANTAVDQRWLNDMGKILYYIESMRGESTTSNELEAIKGMISTEAGRLASSSVPMSRFLKQFEKSYVDPESRSAEGFLQEIQKTIPGLSKDNPSYKDLWGNAYIADESVGPDVYSKTKSFVSPFQTVPEKMDLVSQELFKVPVNLPSLVKDIHGVRLSKAEQIKIQEYTGKGISGKPLYDALEEVINSNIYNNAKTKGKAVLLQNVINLYKNAARDKLLDDSKKYDPTPDSLYNRYIEAIEYEQSLLTPK